MKSTNIWLESRKSTKERVNFKITIVNKKAQ